MGLWRRIKSDLVWYNCFRETFASLIFGVFAGAFYPLLGIYLVHIHGTPLQLGLLGGAPFMGNLAAPLWAKFAVRRRVIPFICGVNFLARLLVLPVGFIHSTWVFTFLVMLHFVLASMGGPAYNVYLQRVYPAKIRGRVMSVVRFVLGGMQAISLTVAGTLIDHVANWMFLVTGLLAILSIIPLSRIEEPEVADSDVTLQKLPSMGRLFGQCRTIPGLFLYLIIFFCFEVGNFLPASVYPMYQVKSLHLTSPHIALLGTLWMVTWCCSYPLWGYAIDKLGGMFCVLFGFALQFLTPIAYTFSGEYWILAAVSILSGAAGSALDGGWINTLMQLDEKRIMMTSSLHMQLSGVRGASLPLLGSVIAPTVGDTHLFLVSAFFIILAIFPGLLFQRSLRTHYEHNGVAL